MESVFKNETITSIFISCFVIYFCLLFFRRDRIGIFLNISIILVTAVVIIIIFKSRAIFLGFLFGSLFSIYKSKISVNKYILKCSLGIILILFISLLFYKSKSTSGRILIYKISTTILMDHWQMGIGLGKFMSQYNEYQAKYFSDNNINSTDAILADNTFYCFNDYFQWIIETGLLGMVTLFVVIIFLYKRSMKLLRQRNSNRAIVATISCLIIIAVASMFSNPMQMWPVQLLTLCFVCIVLFSPVTNNGNTNFGRNVLCIIKASFILLSCIFVISTFCLIKRINLEKEAFYLAKYGYTNRAIEKYKKLYNFFPVNGYNRFLFAEQLYYTNRLKEASEVIRSTTNYFVNNEVYSLIAKIEIEKGNFDKAEINFKKAIFVVPNRMNSRSELMDYYISICDTSNALKWANSILNMPIKIPSAKTDLILNNVKKKKSSIEKK